MKTEKVLRGSKEGFCDSVKTNAALVRKRIRDTRLKVEQSSIGVRSNTVVQLLYVEDLVHEELLTAVKERLESFAVDGILDSGMLEQLTEEAWYSSLSSVSDNGAAGPGCPGAAEWKSSSALRQFAGGTGGSRSIQQFYGKQ